MVPKTTGDQMIYILDHKNQDQYGEYLRQMHKQRFETFVQARHWQDLESWFGLEIDEYDSLVANYIVLIDEGRLIGSVRVMSTYYGTFLGEKYAKYITEPDYISKSGEDVFGPHIWEMFRLYVDDSEWRSPEGVPAIRMLWIAMLEYLLDNGAEKVVAVSDSGLVKKIPPTIKHRELGQRHPFSQGPIEDGEFALVELEVDADSITRLRQALNYHTGQYQRPEGRLDPCPTAISPQQIHLVNRWLDQNPERINTAREILSSSDRKAKSAAAFKELVREAMSSSMDVSDGGSIGEFKRVWH